MTCFIHVHALSRRPAGLGFHGLVRFAPFGQLAAVLALPIALGGCSSWFNGDVTGNRFTLAADPLIAVPCSLKSDANGRVTPQACSDQGGGLSKSATANYSVPSSDTSLATIAAGLASSLASSDVQAVLGMTATPAGSTVSLGSPAGAVLGTLTPASVTITKADPSSTLDSKVIGGKPVVIALSGSPSGGDVISVNVSVGEPGQLTPLRSVHLMVQDSEIKCAMFVNRLFASDAGMNLLLDVGSTISSAVATAVGGAAVKSGFSAASSIFGGTKTAITTDFLNSVNMLHITQAIQTNYGNDMSTYLTNLAAKDPSTVDPYEERSVILSYHNLCSLSSAEGTIGSSLETTGASSPAKPATASAPLSYQVQPMDVGNTTNLAANIAAAIMTSGDAASGVAATSAANKLTIIAPGQTITLTASGKETFTPPSGGSPFITTVGGVAVAADKVSISFAVGASTPAGAGSPAAPAAAATPAAAPAASATSAPLLVHSRITARAATMGASTH